jgi:diadenosine tetraphosphate (Ap4A) HIT family hydrolase
MKRRSKAAAKASMFCELPTERVIASNVLAFAARDGYPVTELHTLVIPRRHAATFLDPISVQTAETRQARRLLTYI